jgi:hypothetical protein
MIFFLFLYLTEARVSEGEQDAKHIFFMWM